MAKIESDGVTYVYADGTGGLQSIPDILQNFGTLYMRISPEPDKDIGGKVVISGLYSDHLEFEININKGRFNFIRNADFASQPLIQNTRKDLHFMARWDPESIDVTVLEDGYGSLPKDKKPPIESFQSTTSTPYTTIPDQLIQWARNHSYLSTTDAVSADQFFIEFVNIVYQMQQTIEDTGSQKSFWDFKQGKGCAPTPKAEPQVTATLDLVLRDAAVRHNFQIIPQAGAAGGSLDFQINKAVKDGSIAVIAMEAKHAHAKDIAHGLSKQFPIYMRSVSANFGIYLVLWFKGKDFGLPTESNFNQLQARLERKKRPPSDVRIMHLDLSIPPPPSKR